MDDEDEALELLLEDADDDDEEAADDDGLELVDAEVGVATGPFFLSAIVPAAGVMPVMELK